MMAFRSKPVVTSGKLRGKKVVVILLTSNSNYVDENTTNRICKMQNCNVEILKYELGQLFRSY